MIQRPLSAALPLLAVLLLACPGSSTDDPKDPRDTSSPVLATDHEVCDGLDNDGDGDVDEDAADATTSFPDGDGDGFGDPARAVTACGIPASHIPQGADCDDTDPAVHPDAEETCDGVDQDCDRILDDVPGSPPCYPDADGDGWGTDGDVLEVCACPDGYAPVPGDCDDRADTDWPGAPEICDGYDNDCDGTTDEDCTEG